jgi:hypothetical protein
MRFRFMVEAEAERIEGKFASRDELADQMRSEIEGSSPGYVEGDAGGQYEVTDWSVEDVEQNGVVMVLSLSEVRAIEKMREEKRAKREGS